MAKPNAVLDTKQLCADSHDLIHQSSLLIKEAGVSCAAHRDQIKKAKEAVVKSREQISQFRLGHK
jgi:hypothetical protein